MAASAGNRRQHRKEMREDGIEEDVKLLKSAATCMRGMAKPILRQ